MKRWGWLRYRRDERQINLHGEALIGRNTSFALQNAKSEQSAVTVLMLTQFKPCKVCGRPRGSKEHKRHMRANPPAAGA